jgi:hypothetical protein
MFELYQVKAVHVKFIPYKWEYPGGVGAVQTTGYPSWSIIDPENTLPSIALPGSYYSYGNCKDEKPYNEHRRSMNSYTDLGLSKQNSLILPTNGTSASRSLYSDPATIGLLARAPTQASGAPIGLIVWTIDYEFSGQRAPNVALYNPIPQQICSSSAPQEETGAATLTELSEDEARSLRALLTQRQSAQ